MAWWPSTLGGVWAFSDTDAYVMGTIIDGTPPYASRIGKHWNGITWEDNINGTWGYDNLTGTWGDISIGPRNDITGDDHFMVAVGYWGISGTKYGGVAEFDNRIKKWKSYQLQDAVGELRSVWTDRNGYFVAVGDNGMVYTKDGYSASWVYQKAPTNFNLTKVTEFLRPKFMQERIFHSSMDITMTNIGNIQERNGTSFLIIRIRQGTSLNCQVTIVQCVMSLHTGARLQIRYRFILLAGIRFC